jgi:hypothetical protein
MNNGSKIGLVIAVLAVIVLAVTNPSLSQFNTWTKSDASLLQRLTCDAKPTGNYLLFSRYEYQCVGFTNKYIGALGTFYQTNKDESEKSTSSH